MQAVPTGVVKGPDGFYYVSQLTGFPFPPGGARCSASTRARASTRRSPPASRTSWTSTSGADGTLYVLEIDSDSLLGPGGYDDGGLWTVSRSGTPQKIALPAGTLTMPGGIAVGRHGKLYVSNRATENDFGEVLRIDLGRR